MSLTVSRPFSVETRRRLTVSRPFSVETRRRLTVTRPFSVRTSNRLTAARPFSVETRRAFSKAVPFSVRTGLAIPAAVLSGESCVEPRAILTLPDGEELRVSDASVEHVLNAGWTWRVVLPHWFSPWDYVETDLFRLTIYDGLGSVCRTPPLVLQGRELSSSGSEGCSLSGVDVATHRMRKEGINLGTYRKTTSSAILSAVFAAVGQTAIGVPSIPQGEEFVNQAQAVDLLLRYLAIAAMDYFVDSLGRVVCIQFQACGERYQAFPEEIQRSGDPTSRTTSWRLQKTSSIQNEKDYTFDTPGFKVVSLPQPFRNLEVQDLSTLGNIDEIGVWAGDPTGKGKLIILYSFGGVGILTTPQNGAWPATHVSCNVYPPSNLPTETVVARLRVRGTPEVDLPDGVELSFSYDWSNGQPGRFGGVWTEPSWPNLAWVVGRAQLYAWMKDRGLDQITMSSKLDCSFGLVDRVFAVTQAADTPRTWPDMRIERISHTLSYGAAPTTTIQGMVIPW